jgi:type IX secretion system substrate protein
MKKLLLSFLVTACAAQFVCSQATFHKAIGGSGDDGGNCLIQASDDGYVVCGYTASFGAGSYDVYVVKSGSSGMVQWTKTFGGSGNEFGNSIIKTADGGYAIGGQTDSYGAGNYDVYIIKLDSSGNLQWTKTIGGSDEDICTSIIQLADGSYILGGWTYSFGAGNKDAYLIKFDDSGNLQWTQVIGGTGVDWVRDVTLTSDGGFAAGGYTSSFGAGSYDVYVIKEDSSGIVQWTKTIGGNDLDYGHSIIQTNDGGYAVCGYTTSFGVGSNDLYVVKLDGSGNLQWTKTIGTSGGTYIGLSLIQKMDDSYVITGYGYTGGTIPGIFTYKLDGSGNLQWLKYSGGGSNDYSSTIIQTSDNGYAICGRGQSYGMGNFDMYLIRTDSSGNYCGSFAFTGTSGSGGTTGSGGAVSSGGSVSGGGTVSSGGVQTNVCSTVGTAELANENTIEIFPNPNKGQFMIHSRFQPGSPSMVRAIKIFNIFGEIVYREIISSDFKTSVTIDFSAQPKGIYLLQTTIGDKSYIRKLIIQ